MYALVYPGQPGPVLVLLEEHIKVLVAYPRRGAVIAVALVDDLAKIPLGQDLVSTLPLTLTHEKGTLHRIDLMRPSRRPTSTSIPNTHAV